MQNPQNPYFSLVVDDEYTIELHTCWMMMDDGWWMMMMMMMMLPFGWFESPLTRMVVNSLPLPPSGLAVDSVLFPSWFCWLCTMVNHPKKGTIWGICLDFCSKHLYSKGRKWVPWQGTIAVLLKTLPHFALWFQIFVYFHPYLGKWSNLTSIFFKWVGSTTN